MSDADFAKLVELMQAVDGGCGTCIKSAYTHAGQLWPELRDRLQKSYATTEDYNKAFPLNFDED